MGSPICVGKIYPFEVFLPGGTSGLEKESKIMSDQMRSIDKRRLVRKVGVVDHDFLLKACAIVRKLIGEE